MAMPFPTPRLAPVTMAVGMSTSAGADHSEEKAKPQGAHSRCPNGIECCMPRSRVTEAAIPAEKLKASFPKIDLPIRPPFPPMEAKLVDNIPPAGKDTDGDWQ